jgi:hypothetical protein
VGTSVLCITCQNLILAVTAVIGLSSYILTSRGECRRATVDVLLKHLSDLESVKVRRHVYDLLTKGLDIPLLLSDTGMADRRAILTLLNEYEFIASGIRLGAFDETVFKQMSYTPVVDDWRDLKPFVDEWHKANPTSKTVYQDFKTLAERWRSQPLDDVDDQWP